METNELSPTPAREWKKKSNLDGRDLPLPSGNVALVKPIAPTAFMTNGMIPDPLTALIRKAINEKKGLPPSAMQKMAEDPVQLSAALEMFDRVLVAAVILPEISMPPACDIEVEGEVCGDYANTDVHKTPHKSGHHQYHEGQRDPDVLYADEVEFQDKVFIFQWCLGGTSDLERFRSEQAKRMESVSDGSNVQRPTKRAAKRK